MKHSIKQYVFLFVMVTTGLFASHNQDVLRYNAETFQPEEYSEFHKAYAYQAVLTYKLECEAEAKEETSKEEYLRGFDVFVAHQNEDIGVYAVELILAKPYEAYTNGLFSAQTLKELEWRTVPFEADFSSVRREIENAYDGVLFKSTNPKFRKTEFVYKVALENDFDPHATRIALVELEWKEDALDVNTDSFELECMRFNKVFASGLFEGIEHLNKDRELPLIEKRSFLDGLRELPSICLHITQEEIDAYIEGNGSDKLEVREQISFAMGRNLARKINSSNCTYRNLGSICKQFYELCEEHTTLPYEKEYSQRFGELYMSFLTDELHKAMELKMRGNND